MRSVQTIVRQWTCHLLVFGALACMGIAAHAATGTAFTYQGRVALTGTTVTGTLNFEFELYDAVTGGISVGGPIVMPGVVTSDGLFTVSLDFGPGAFQGDQRWLEIRVGSPLNTLSPRQELRPTPYAIYATGATNAANATTANFATNAGNALTANSATNATNAVNAATANFATNAGNALTANNATNATNATNAVNATNATTAATATNALALGGVPPSGYSLVGHTHAGSAITGITAKSVVFGSAGGNLTDDGVNFSYDSATKDLTVGRDLNLTSATAVYRIAGNAVVRVAPASDNTFIGLAGNAAVTGTANTAVGDTALAVASSSSSNTAIGANALAAANTNSGNTAVGANALKVAVGAGINNTAVGSGAMIANTTGFANTAIGVSALAANIGGFINTAVGAGALAANTADANVAVGVQALASNTTGGNNTAVGTSALLSNIGGSSNSAFGQTALNFNTSGSGNTAIGSAALQANTFAGQNTAVGASAATKITIGGGNTAVGAFSLAGNQTGVNNTAIGSTALQAATSANNTAVGVGALKAVTIGDLNVGLGLDAGNAITTGTKNIVIGSSAGFLLTGADNNNIVIGHTGGTGDVGKIRIGSTGTHTDARIAGISGTAITGPALTVVVNANGQLGTSVSSSGRFKEDVRDMIAAPDQLLALRPVTFRYRAGIAPEGDARAEQYGLIAEEVAEVNPHWAVRDRDGTIVSVRYDQINAALLSLAQRQQAQIDALTQQLNAVAARIERLQAAAGR